LTVCQGRLELSETEETKLEKYCFLEVRINLWYWFRRDLKEDLSMADNALSVQFEPLKLSLAASLCK